jgi:nucleotide-binding universal stress UspA family protein
LEAELHGIYVEDINLLRISEMPFARRLGVYSAARLPLQDQGGIEQEMRAHANLARRRLEALAKQMQLQSSFRVARGVIAAELLQASSEADLLILGKTGWSHSNRMGSTTRVLVAQSASHTMILTETLRSWDEAYSTLGVIYNGSDASKRALQAARHLAEGRQIRMDVILLAPDVDQANQLQAQVSEQLKSLEIEVNFRWLVGLERNRLNAVAKRDHFVALLVPAAGEILPGEALESFLNEAQIPVLLVR